MIENYKELLFAIFNTDIEIDKKSVICVYDTKEDDRLIAVFNCSENCARFFKTSYRAINKSICRKHLRNNRYRLERVIVGE